MLWTPEAPDICPEISRYTHLIMFHESLDEPTVRAVSFSILTRRSRLRIFIYGLPN
jgi:hypothetical protein